MVGILPLPRRPDKPGVVIETATNQISMKPLGGKHIFSQHATTSANRDTRCCGRSSQATPGSTLDRGF